MTKKDEYRKICRTILSGLNDFENSLIHFHKGPHSKRQQAIFCDQLLMDLWTSESIIPPKMFSQAEHASGLKDNKTAISFPMGHGMVMDRTFIIAKHPHHYIPTNKAIEVMERLAKIVQHPTRYQMSQMCKSFERNHIVIL